MSIIISNKNVTEKKVLRAVSKELASCAMVPHYTLCVIVDLDSIRLFHNHQPGNAYKPRDEEFYFDLGDENDDGGRGFSRSREYHKISDHVYETIKDFNKARDSNLIKEYLSERYLYN